MSLPETLQRAVYDGLQRVWALRLDGSPAGDTLPAVAKIWCSAISGAPVTWRDDRDLPRFRAAFGRIELLCERWPSPATFMQYLPPVAEPLKLNPPRQHKVPQEFRDLVEKLRMR